MKIVWSPLARNKLNEILEYISRDNTDAALALVDDIEERVWSLKEHPMKGRIIPALNDQMTRELIIRDNYLVVYQISENLIEILTIRHAKQDPEDSGPDRDV